VSNLNAEHNKQMREMRIKHTRDVHKLQQELKEAIALIKERETCHENAMARDRKRLETDLKELIAVCSAKNSCTMKKEYKKHLTEVEDKHKKEMSELQEKLAKVTLERDKARTAISDMVNLGTESLSSNLSTSTNQGANDDGDSLSLVEEVVVSLEDLQRNFPEARDFIAFAKSLYPTLKSITYGTSVNLNSFLPSHTLLTYLLLLLLARPARVFSDV